jgi:hypothetical protein
MILTIFWQSSRRYAVNDIGNLLDQYNLLPTVWKIARRLLLPLSARLPEDFYCLCLQDYQYHLLLNASKIAEIIYFLTPGRLPISFTV